MRVPDGSDWLEYMLNAAQPYAEDAGREIDHSGAGRRKSPGA